jgi:hypothetical protein
MEEEESEGEEEEMEEEEVMEEKESEGEEESEREEEEMEEDMMLTHVHKLTMEVAKIQAMLNDLIARRTMHRKKPKRC